MVEAFPCLIATADETNAIVVRNGVSTRWKPFEEDSSSSDGEANAIVGISVIHAPRPNTVAVANAKALSFWDVSGDAPSKLLYVDVPLAVLHCTATDKNLLLVLANTADTQRQRVQFAALNFGQKTGGGQGASILMVHAMALYDIELDVPFNGASCSVTTNANSDDPLIVLDTGKTISVYTVSSRIQRKRAAEQPQAPIPAPASAAAAPAGYAAAAAGAGVAVPPVAAPLSVPAPMSAHHHQPPSYGAAAAPPPFYNNQMGAPSKSGGGGVATDADFDRQLESFNNRLQANASRVRGKAQDLASVLPVDHEALLAQALDSQRETLLTSVRTAVAKELEQFRSKQGGSSSVQLDEETSAQISEVVIRGVSDSIVENVAKGISESINTQLARRVESLVQGSVTAHVKRLKRKQDKEGNKGVEGVASEVLTAARDELEKKQKDYGMQLLYQLQQLNLPATQMLQKMQKIIENQQKFINDFTSSGLVEEVERLREEVSHLRAAGAHSAAAPSKAAILQRARDAIAAGNVDNGLQWVLQQNDSSLTFALISSIDEDKFHEVVESSDNVPSARWERVATDLAEIVSGDHLATILRIIHDLVSSDRAAILKNAKVKEVLRGYVNTWKASPSQLPQDVRGTLRDLSVELR